MRFLVFEIWYRRFCTQNSQNILSILTSKTDQKFRRGFVQKDVQCSEMNAQPNFRFLRFLAYEIWLILYSKFLVNWGLSFRLLENLIQKRKPVIPHNQLAWMIQSKSIRDKRRRRGAKLPTSRGGGEVLLVIVPCTMTS